MREEDRIFDQQVRSMMENAEVKPPRGVFSAVSRRLAPAAVLNQRRRSFAYVGLGLAAALAAVFFVTSPTESGADIEIMQSERSPVAQAVASADDFSSEDSVEAATVPFATAAPVETAVTVEPEAAAEAAAPVETEATPVEPVAEPRRRFASELSNSSVSEPSSTADDAAASSAGAPGSESERVSIPAETFDTFSPEPRRRTSRVSFTAGGLVSANNAGTGPVVMGSSPGISIAANNSTILETSTSSYGVPVSLSLGVRFQLSENLSIGTGVDYSLLSRTFSGKYDPSHGAAVDADFRHTMHYLGIPLDLYYTLYAPGSLRIYVYAGGEAEYCVSNKYAISTATGSETFSSPVSGLQFSVGGGLGVEFRISQHLGIFLDPGINYYFNCHQPKNVRTEKPMLFNIDAGLRFGF